MAARRRTILPSRAAGPDAATAHLPALRAVAWGALAVFLVALVVRAIGLDQQAANDELYHVLAGRQFLQDGTLRINGGAPYTRVAFMTYLVAEFMRLFGASLAAARMPAAIAGALCAVALYAWLALRGQRGAGWIAAGLYCLAPQSIVIAQQARFYTLQQLTFLLGVIAALAALEGRTRAQRGGLAAAALLMLATALHLQPISLIGVAGLGLFLLAAILPGALPWLRARRLLGPALAGVAALLVLGGAAALALDLPARAVRLATYADLWAQGVGGTPLYYYWLVDGQYPVFWPLFPLLLVFAVLRDRRVALVSAAVFVVAFAVQSGLAWRSARYFEYVMPFFFAVLGLGLAGAAPAVRAALHRAWGTERASARWRRIGSALSAAVIVLVLVVTTAALRMTVHNALRDQRFVHPGMENGSLSWSEAARRLRPVLDSVATVVASEDLHALFYLGRLDYVVNRDHLHVPRGSQPEFYVDPKVARSVVSAPASLDEIMRCHDSGLVVVTRYSAGKWWKVPQPTMDFLAAHAERVPLPEAWGIEAFRWRQPIGSRPAVCHPAVPTGWGS
ncbi:MAG TPA: hypothetical protein VFS40_14440 [Gemmatimonadales bacterium]|nr:hypothetical protein [Gemmatimonadales bacterium]